MGNTKWKGNLWEADKLLVMWVANADCRNHSHSVQPARRSRMEEGGMGLDPMPRMHRM